MFDFRTAVAGLATLLASLSLLVLGVLVGRSRSSTECVSIATEAQKSVRGRLIERKQTPWNRDRDLFVDVCNDLEGIPLVQGQYGDYTVKCYERK